MDNCVWERLLHLASSNRALPSRHLLRIMEGEEAIRLTSYPPESFLGCLSSNKTYLGIVDFVFDALDPAITQNDPPPPWREQPAAAAAAAAAGEWVEN